MRKVDQSTDPTSWRRRTQELYIAAVQLIFLHYPFCWQFTWDYQQCTVKMNNWQADLMLTGLLSDSTSQDKKDEGIGKWTFRKRENWSAISCSQPLLGNRCSDGQLHHLLVNFYSSASSLGKAKVVRQSCRFAQNHTQQIFDCWLTHTHLPTKPTTSCFQWTSADTSIKFPSLTGSLQLIRGLKFQQERKKNFNTAESSCCWRNLDSIVTYLMCMEDK